MGISVKPSTESLLMHLLHKPEAAVAVRSWKGEIRSCVHTTYVRARNTQFAIEGVGRYQNYYAIKTIACVYIL